MKVLAWSGSGESSLLGSEAVTFSLSPHMVERVLGVSFSSYKRVLILSRGPVLAQAAITEYHKLGGL